MDTRDRSAMANVVGWLALIISIIALILAWTAFNNASEENLGEMIQDQIQGTVQNEQQPGEVNSPATDGTTTTPGTGTEGGVDGTTNPTPGAPEDDAVRPDTN